MYNDVIPYSNNADMLIDVMFSKMKIVSNMEFILSLYVGAFNKNNYNKFELDY